MRVKELLIHQPRAFPSLTDRQTIADAVKTMIASETGALIVTSDSGPTGILTRSDVLRAWADSPAKPFQETELREAMSSQLITAEPGDDVAATVDVMLRAEVVHMPICENGQIVAILSIHDLVAHHIQALHGELEQMNDYIDRLHDSYQD